MKEGTEKRGSIESIVRLVRRSVRTRLLLIVTTKLILYFAIASHHEPADCFAPQAKEVYIRWVGDGRRW